MGTVEKENCFGEKIEVSNIGIIRKDMEGNIVKAKCRKCHQPNRKLKKSSYWRIDKVRR